jgi:hypothetical protein
MTLEPLYAWQDMPKPRARSNAMLAIAGDTLWLFGGIVEVNPQTLNHAVRVASHDLWLETRQFVCTALPYHSPG